MAFLLIWHWLHAVATAYVKYEIVIDYKLQIILCPCLPIIRNSMQHPAYLKISGSLDLTLLEAGLKNSEFMSRDLSDILSSNFELICPVE